jgi:hypothetical protein
MTSPKPRRQRQPLKVSSAIADKLNTEAYLSHAARATSHVPAPTVSCPGPDSGCHPRGCHPRWMRHGVAKRTVGGCVRPADHHRRCSRIRSPAPQSTAWLSPHDLQVPHEACGRTLLRASHVRTAQSRQARGAHNLLRASAHFQHRSLPSLPPGAHPHACYAGLLRGSCQCRVGRIRNIRDLHSTPPGCDQAIRPQNCGNASRHSLRNSRRCDTRATLIIFPQSGA